MSEVKVIQNPVANETTQLKADLAKALEKVKSSEEEINALKKQIQECIYVIQRLKLSTKSLAELI